MDEETMNVLRRKYSVKTQYQKEITYLFGVITSLSVGSKNYTDSHPKNTNVTVLKHETDVHISN